MRNIMLTEDEIIRKREQFFNDPRRLQLLKQRTHIIERAIPSYIVDLNTKEFKTIYDTNTQKVLDYIDERMKSIIDEYKFD